MLNLILILLGLRQPTVDTALKGLMIAEKQLKTAAKASTAKAVKLTTNITDANRKRTAQMEAAAKRFDKVSKTATAKRAVVEADAARATRVSAKIADLTA